MWQACGCSCDRAVIVVALPEGVDVPDGVIGVAAVCDYRPRERWTGKLSKTGRPIVVEFVENPDILAEVSKKSARRPIVVVGFAAETENLVANAQAKLARNAARDREVTRELRRAGWRVVRAHRFSPVQGGDGFFVALLTQNPA